MPQHPLEPDVEVRLPADGAYASVVRTTAAGLAARLDFSIDDIEDLRIAVGEAVALLLAAASPAASLVAAFQLSPGRLHADLSVPVIGPVAVPDDSIAWHVLSALATDCSADTRDGRFTVAVTMCADHSSG
ncbi:MAG: hypothetical protein M9891_17035 [Austwickia sp.]|nr:hypothetical protein [Austwickia sp.]